MDNNYNNGGYQPQQPQEPYQPQQPQYQQPYQPQQPQQPQYYQQPMGGAPMGGAPMGGAPMGQLQPTDPNAKTFAIVSLICGIAGIALPWWSTWLPFITLIASIVGLVFAVKARNGLPADGKGMATAGLVLCIIGIVLSAIGTACSICVLCVGSAVQDSVDELNNYLGTISSYTGYIN